MTLADLFELRTGEAEVVLGAELPVTWDIGPYSHFKTARGFGVTFQDLPYGPCHVRLAKKLLRSTTCRQDGVIRHELGHVVDLVCDPRSLSAWAAHRGVHLAPRRQGELRADDIAEAIWGEPIRYDKATVQSACCGVHPRPKRLGY